MCKKKRINVVSVFQNRDLLVKKNRYQINKKILKLKLYHFTTSIWYVVHICLSQITWKYEKPMLTWF